MGNSVAGQGWEFLGRRPLREDEDFLRTEWRCFSCGRVFDNRHGLKVHLNSCYWYQEHFKDDIENAPFYRKLSSRQLRFYYRHRREVLVKRAARYDAECAAKGLRVRERKRLGVKGLDIGRGLDVVH